MSANGAGDTAPSLRSSKRKRDQVSYLDDDYFAELDLPQAELVDDQNESDDGEADESYGRKRSNKVAKLAKKKSKKASKAKKVKPFRFLDLSAELRNEIYQLVLTEPNGLTLVSEARNNRRVVRRGSIAVTNSKHYYGKAHHRQNWSRRRISTTPNSVENNRVRLFVPNLLATNRQVREEASGYLYKQEIIVADTHVMHGFVATIGTYNRKLLTHITVRGWTEGIHNFAAFAMLQFCENLECLFFDCTLGWYRRPKPLASQIYRDGHLFLEAISRAKGSAEAAVKVIQFGAWHFNKKRVSHARYRNVWHDTIADGEPEFDGDQREIFAGELERQIVRGS